MKAVFEGQCMGLAGAMVKCNIEGGAPTVNYSGYSI